jgi:hypothetical protein
MQATQTTNTPELQQLPPDILDRPFYLGCDAVSIKHFTPRLDGTPAQTTPLYFYALVNAHKGSFVATLSLNADGIPEYHAEVLGHTVKGTLPVPLIRTKIELTKKGKQYEGL